MLQDNSFFSFPVTYFGSPHEIEEEEEQDEWTFADLIRISTTAPFLYHQQPRIGLFIHWCDVGDPPQ